VSLWYQENAKRFARASGRSAEPGTSRITGATFKLGGIGCEHATARENYSASPSRCTVHHCHALQVGNMS